MRITLLNQTFHPDVGSSGQHLTDLALSLAARGHKVTVITSRRAYDDPGQIFPKQEDWRGMRIYRVFNTGFGKRAKWRRAADFASFLISCSGRLCRLPKQDLVVALTSPPLVSALGAWFARVRGGRFCYWVMDLNPDEAVAAGWLDSGSLAARSLERISRYSLRRASTVVVLDRFMQQRILDKGIDGRKVGVLAPWSHDSEVRFDVEGRNRFRTAHGLQNKFVVMYSGNHSPCHPLDSILSAARALAQQKDVAFCFVGGGSEFVRVKQFSAEHGLTNITCLPYQPLDQLAGTLSAADLHLVVMGNPFVGLVHPCKIYNILRVGLPLLYVGPRPSHVTELLEAGSHSFPCRFARHGEVNPIIEHILGLKKNRLQINGNEFKPLARRFSKEILLPQMIEMLEASGNADSGRWNN
jgi:colanic acid biosynthesis glycosyl transferase WcaI